MTPARKSKDPWIALGVWVGLFGILLVLILTKAVDNYTIRIFTLAGINVMVALSLNLITGFTGQLALGHAGFMALGAYTAAILTNQFGMHIIPSMFMGGALSGMIALLIGIPALKLRGDYLAIVTLGFGEIIRVVLINLPTITGGSAGYRGIPPFSTDSTLNPLLGFIYVFLVTSVVVVFLFNLIRSSHGRVFIAIREDEIATSAMGVNVFHYKLFAFVISGVIAGIAGGLYAPVSRFLTPLAFDFIKSVDFVIIVVLGGLGSMTGTIIAGIILTYAQEALRVFNDFRLIIYALLLVIMMIFRPEGLFGTREFSLKNLIALSFFKKKPNPSITDDSAPSLSQEQKPSEGRTPPHV